MPLSLFAIWSFYIQTNTSCIVSDVFQKCLAFGLHTTLAWWPTDQVIASKDRSWKFHELSVRQLQCLPTVKSSNEIGTLLVLKYKYWLSFANQIFIEKIQKVKTNKKIHGIGQQLLCMPYLSSGEPTELPTRNYLIKRYISYVHPNS